MRLKAKGVSWSFYLNHGLASRVTSIGGKLGSHSLIYNPFLFRVYQHYAVMDAPGVVSSLKHVFPEAKVYVDVGAGSGGFAAEALRQGVKAVACEHSRAGRKIAERQGVECYPFDLTLQKPADLNRTFDLAYCFEVAEHLPEDLALRLVDFIVAQAPVVVFSAAHPGQGGTGHINEQPKDYWIQQFAKRGMTYRQELTERLLGQFKANNVASSWFFDNAMVFTQEAS